MPNEIHMKKITADSVVLFSDSNFIFFILASKSAGLKNDS